MNAQLKRHWKWLLPCMIVLVLLTSVWIYRDHRSNALQRYYENEILTMSPDTTAADLEKDGYLNLTQTQESRIADITTFLTSDSYFRPVILKTFRETAEGLVIRYFYLPDGFSTVTMTTYTVKAQGIISPNSPFSSQLTETVNEDGTTDVWLIPAEKDVSYAQSNPSEEPVHFYTYNTNS